MADERYGEDPRNMTLFPDGKGFRVVYDPTVGMLRLFARRLDDFEDVRKAFSVKNKSAFYSNQYGYKADDRLYNINKFGYFKPGLFFKVAEWIKTQYGSLQVLALSPVFQQYFNDVIRPLGKYLSVVKGEFEVSNIAEDSGANDMIRLEIAKLIEAGEDPDDIKIQPYEFRPY